MIFSLDGRLSVCAEFVRPNTRLADVGTDHAYLPIWLAVNGRIRSAVASDIRQKPLASGLENIQKYGCGDIVSVRLCSGLDAILPDEADDIVMAGMGGELIVKLINNAPWLKNPEKRLILQPMTRANIVREYLFENGFEILGETPCTAAGKIYTVICCEYTGKKVDHTVSDTYIGMLNSSNELACEYMKVILNKLKYKRNGLLHTGEDISVIDQIICEIQENFGGEDNDSSK